MLRRLFCLFLLLAPVSAVAAPKVQMVKLDSGPTVWLVEDRSAPVVTLQFAWKWTGSLSEPKDKTGLARFAMGMMDEGAGDLESGAFQGRLDDLNASMDFGAGSENLSLTVRSLSATLPEAMSLTKSALTEPRFDAAAVERVRGQIRQSLSQSMEMVGRWRVNCSMRRSIPIIRLAGARVRPLPRSNRSSARICWLSPRIA